MHFTPTDIDGPVVVDLAPHGDERLLPMGVAEGCRLGGRWTWTRTSRMTTSSSPPVAWRPSPDVVSRPPARRSYACGAEGPSASESVR
jgi:hypothetical protein